MLEIISEGAQRELGDVDLSKARLVFDRDLSHTRDAVLAPEAHVHDVDEQVVWDEILHPQRSWVATTLLFDSGHRPYVSIDLGPLTDARKQHVASGVNMGITFSVSRRTLRILKP